MIVTMIGIATSLRIRPSGSPTAADQASMRLLLVAGAADPLADRAHQRHRANDRDPHRDRREHHGHGQDLHVVGERGVVVEAEQAQGRGRDHERALQLDGQEDRRVEAPEPAIEASQDRQRHAGIVSGQAPAGRARVDPSRARAQVSARADPIERTWRARTTEGSPSHRPAKRCGSFAASTTPAAPPPACGFLGAARDGGAPRRLRRLPRALRVRPRPRRRRRTATDDLTPPKYRVGPSSPHGHAWRYLSIPVAAAMVGGALALIQRLG